MEDFGLAFLVVGVGILALPYLNPKDDRVRVVLFGVCILLIWRYVWWRFAATMPPFALSFDSLFAWCFSSVEALAIVGWTVCFVTLSRTRDRSCEATEQRASLERSNLWPRVDVLIATYNEEMAILARTIVGARGINYPRMRVWVLDDGRRPWLEDLCATKGANYLARPDNEHAKAGNINHALDFLRDHQDPPEFVAIFDADVVPHSEFLLRTIPLFHDPSVGLVQTPQHFFNRDPIQSNLVVGHVWPDEQRFFFDHVLASKDAWGAAFCCGTSSVVRMRALDACGGHVPTESVTEDFLLTLELDRAGWRTIYLNEPLGVGLAPEGINEYITQRGRWCLGLMQILRSRWGLFSRQRLSLPYRIGLVDAFLYWSVSHLFKLLCLSAPIVYWFTGVTVGTATPGAVISHFLPAYAAMMLALRWATGGLIQPVFTDVAVVLTMPAALRATVIGLLKPRGQKFKVTPKGGRRDRVQVEWPMISGFGLLASLTITGMLYASFADYAPERQTIDATSIVLFWSIYNIVVLILAMTACVELPRYRREERRTTAERVRISTADDWFAATLADISLAGARILSPAPREDGGIVSLTIDDVGEVVGRVVRGADASFAVEFAHTEGSRDALTLKLFSGRYSEHRRNVQGFRLLHAVVARAFR